MAGTPLEDRYITVKTEDHIKNKSLWGGSHEKAQINDYFGIDKHKKIFRIEREHSLVIFTCINEIIVNAIDQVIENINKKDLRVTEIVVDFDKTTGVITIFNNGSGIPIILHNKATEEQKRNVYIPDLVFTVPFSGTNIKREKNTIKGGTNGLGCKIANFNSEWMIIKTCDGSNVYEQKFTDRGKNIGIPEIRKSKTGKQYVRVEFLLDFKSNGYKEVKKEDLEDIEGWIRMRCEVASIYISWIFNAIDVTPTKIIFNEKESKGRKISDLSKRFCDLEDLDTLEFHGININTDSESHPWDISILINPKNDVPNISILNGMICNGNHMKKISEIMRDEVAKKIGGDRKIPITKINKMTRIFLVASIKSAEWNAQIKNEVSLEKKFINQIDFVRNKTFTKMIDSIANAILLSDKKKLKATVKPRAGKIIELSGRYYPALTRKRSEPKYLLCVEGSSAMGFTTNLLSQSRKQGAAKSNISRNNFGEFSLQGVIMNSIKNSTKYLTESGEEIIKISSKLSENKTLQLLSNIIGFVKGYKYEKDDIDKLNYQGIIIAVDADCDGMGKILPLLLVFIYRFFPSLIENGFVRKLATPVVRLNTRGKSPSVFKEFYHEMEFDNWVKESEQSFEDIQHKYEISYIKGLATNSNKDVERIYKNIDKCIFTLTLDKFSDEVFNIYYGSNPNLRKDELRTPAKFYTEHELKKIIDTKKISCSRHIQVDSKIYKLDDIGRKIPNVIDGLTRTKRKILASSFSYFGGKKAKIYQFGGHVTEKMHYHHGDMSLNNTIIVMIQNFPGAVNFPYLISFGQSGTRAKAGNDCGSPRYIDIRSSKKFINLVFPSEDNYLLDYNYDEGDRTEPRFFVPVIPMNILESQSLPSEGWKHSSFARKLSSTLELLMLLLDSGKQSDITKQIIKLSDKIGTHDGKVDPDDIIEANNLEKKLDKSSRLSIDDKRFAGKIIDDEIQYGDYEEVNSTEIIIKELPMWMSASEYINKIRRFRADDIKSINDVSGQNNIEIIITFNDKSILSKKREQIIEYLYLNKKLKSFLNFTDQNGAVKEYDNSYLCAFLHWFYYRKQLYKIRVKKEIVVIEAKIALLENMNKYTKLVLDEKINPASIEDPDSFTSKLKKYDIKKINSDYINSILSKYDNASVFESRCNDETGTYDYIFNMRQKDIVIEEYNKRQKEIEKLTTILDELNKSLKDIPFSCAGIWMEEVIKIKKLLEKYIDGDYDAEILE